MSDPIVFQAGGCPICGGDVMADESKEGGNFIDGEYAFCASNCGWFGNVSVVEDDGEAFPSTAADLYPIIERLEEVQDQADKMAGLLRECLEFACPNGEPPTSDLACRIAAVLDRAPAPRQASNSGKDGVPEKQK